MDRTRTTVNVRQRTRLPPPIAVLVLSLPLIIGFSRLVAARRQRLEYGLLRQPLRAGLGPQRLQLANVILLCALLALTVYVGVYNPVALQLGLHRILQAAFMLSLAVLVLTGCEVWPIRSTVMTKVLAR